MMSSIPSIWRSMVAAIWMDRAARAAPVADDRKLHGPPMNVQARGRALAWRLGWNKSPLEKFYEQLDVAELQEQLKTARDNNAVDVSESLLLTLATLRTPQCRVSKEKRA